MRVSDLGANLLVKVLLTLIRQPIGSDRWWVVYRGMIALFQSHDHLWEAAS